MRVLLSSVFPQLQSVSSSAVSQQQNPPPPCTGTSCTAAAPSRPPCQIEQLTGLALPPSALQSPDPVMRTLAVVARIERNLRSTLYSHQLTVDEARGSYQFDCSLMVSWILQRSAPQAHQELGGRGIAEDYVHTLEAIAPDQPTPGWRRVSRIAEIQSGDVVAWRTPAGLPSSASGHVVIAAGRPIAYRNGFLLRVVDSTSFPHGEDTRRGGSGFGYGTLYFEVNPQTGEGTAYGWTGRYSAPYVLRTPIVVGRPLS